MLADGLTVGNLTSFSMYTGYMYVSVGQMSVAVSEFMKAQGASRRVFTVIDTGTLNMETGGLRLPDSYHERVVFEDVHFAYPTRPGVEVQYAMRACPRHRRFNGATAIMPDWVPRTPNPGPAGFERLRSCPGAWGDIGSRR